ncbi:hypothetical protein NECAME_11828, partial [Necator americanus]
LTTYALEAVNAYEVIVVKQRNVWGLDIDEKKSWYYGLTFRLLFSFAAVGGAVIAVGASAFNQLTTQWTCVGIYSQNSINLWLPLVLLNLILALAASAYSYKASFIQWYLPQYEEKMEKNTEKMDLAARSNVEKHYVPKCKRGRIRKCWMRTYAKMRVEEESRTKSELIWGVFVKELCDHGVYEYSKPVLDQLRYLFKCWVVQTYRSDPKSDTVKPRRTRAGAELEYLLSNYYEVLNSLTILKLTLSSRIQRNDYYNSIENYLRTCDTYDPFLMCMITSMDRNGNTGQIPFLRTPLKLLSIQVLDDMKLASEEENTMSHRNM